MATKMKETIIRLSRSKKKNVVIVIFSAFEILLLLLSYSWEKINTILPNSFVLWIVAILIWLDTETIGNQNLVVVRRKPLIYTILSNMECVIFHISVIICIIAVKISKSVELTFTKLLISFAIITIITFALANVITTFFKKLLS